MILRQIKYWLLFWKRCSSCRRMDSEGYCSKWKVHPAKYKEGDKTYCRCWEKK